MWQRDELEPAIVHLFTELQNDLEDQIENFLTQTDQTRVDITDTKLNESPQTFQTSRLTRICSAMAGLYLMNPGLAITGGLFGWGELAKGLLPQITIGVASFILLGFNPLGIVAAMSMTELARISQMGYYLTQKVVEHFAKQYSALLLESRYVYA